MLSESDFRHLADDELRAIAARLDPLSELTVDHANDIVTIEFDDGEKFVLNQQAPSRQLWFAAAFQAGHYDYDAAARVWKDHKTGETLRARVARDLGHKLGKSVAL